MKIIAVIVFLISIPVALGKEPAPIPPNLVQFKTGAYWEEGEKSGHVRFCAFERGFEHVRHQIVIDWIHSPTDPDQELSVLSRVVVKDLPDVWSVGEAEFVERGEKKFIEFSATNTYSLEEAKFSIELLGIGKIALSQVGKTEGQGKDEE